MSSPIGLRVSVVRHGETDFNAEGLISGWADAVLTPRGIAQAHSLGQTMTERADVAYSSDLTRSIQTARIVLEMATSRIKLNLDTRLREVSFGVLDGTLSRPIPAFQRGDIDYAPAMGESYRQVALRLISFMRDLQKAAKEHEWRHVVVFCHAGPMRILSVLFDPTRHPRSVFSTSFENCAVQAYWLSGMFIHPEWETSDAQSR